MKKPIITLHRFILGLKRPSKTSNLKRLAEQGETISSFKIREANPDDVPALANLHVKTWHETYWTNSYSPNFQIRNHQWQQIFNHSDGSWFCLVIENKNGELIGFAKGQKYGHEDLPEFNGELNKIYLLRKYQRIGLGRKLLGHVARKFLAMDIQNMVLFGIPSNPSCGFHDHLGGERLYAKNGEFHGGYCWRDLQKLADNCPID